MFAAIYFLLAECLADFVTYDVAGVHRFDDERVCHLYERNLEVYLQLEDIRTTELSTPYSIADSSTTCPEVPQLCLKYSLDGYAYSFTRNACSNVTRLAKGPTMVFRFALSYDLLRFDYTTSTIYVLKRPTLYGCDFSSFLNGFSCSLIVRQNVYWEDFLISDGALIFLVNHTVYNGADLAIFKSDVLPYHVFPNLEHTDSFTWWFVIGYVFELVFLLLLVYFFGDRLFQRGPIFYRKPLLQNRPSFASIKEAVVDAPI